MSWCITCNRFIRNPVNHAAETWGKAFFFSSKCRASRNIRDNKMNVQFHFSLVNAMISHLWPCARRSQTHDVIGCWRDQHESFSRGTRDTRVRVHFYSLYIFPQIGNTSNILYRQATQFISSLRSNAIYIFSEELTTFLCSICLLSMNICWWAVTYIILLLAIIIKSNLFRDMRVSIESFIAKEKHFVLQKLLLIT